MYSVFVKDVNRLIKKHTDQLLPYKGTYLQTDSYDDDFSVFGDVGNEAIAEDNTSLCSDSSFRSSEENVPVSPQIVCSNGPSCSSSSPVVQGRENDNLERLVRTTRNPNPSYK
ncbi:hypothetical protein JYU34_003175 [Plutella xylostella]|nr:hypothetical protein JYU34_015180 [Plutella xylostella]KAG7310400.1 hypothetical protein JYU34_003175 [Plutella xylostella]